VFCFPTTTTASHNFLNQIRQFDNGWKGSNCKDLSDATEISREQPTVQKSCSRSLAMAMAEKRKRQQKAARSQNGFASNFNLKVLFNQ
jgi:hypothetical protein